MAKLSLLFLVSSHYSSVTKISSLEITTLQSPPNLQDVSENYELRTLYEITKGETECMYNKKIRQDE